MTSDQEKNQTSQPAARKVEEPVDALRKPRSAGVKSSLQGWHVSGQLSAVGWVTLVALIVVVFLSTALWWQQQRFETVTKEVASRLQSNDERLSLVQKDAQRALALANSQSSSLAQLQRDVRTLRSEVTSMDQAWQSLSHGLDERLLLGDVRRLLGMADQQLALMGNVNSAIAAMEVAQQMLQNQQQNEHFTALLKAVNVDLERLRTVPQINVSALSGKLDSLIELTAKASLMVPDSVAPGLSPIASDPRRSNTPVDQAPAVIPPASDSSANVWWEQWLGQARQAATEATRVVAREFADLVKVRQANDPQALLLSEEQALQLRANVRSMLLSAQLALLMHQSSIWRSELSEVESLLNTRYDPESLDTQAALRLIRELLASPVSVNVTSITESLSALAVASQAISVPAAAGEGQR